MQIFSEIVGVHFRPAEAKQAHNALQIGEQVELEAEPDNAYDPNAVKVMVDIGHGDSGPIMEHIGYVARVNNYEIADYLNDGGTEYTATVNRKEGNKFVLLIDFPWNEVSEDYPVAADD